MTEHINFTSAYMDVIHDEDELLMRAEECLEGVEFDTFVGTGISGTVAALRLSRAMDKRYLLVRKPNDGTHSSKSAEGTLGKRWVFVDDLVASGRTLVRVWNKMKSYNSRAFNSEFAGVFLYGNGYDRAQFILPAQLADKKPGGSEGWQEMVNHIGAANTRGLEFESPPGYASAPSNECGFGVPGCRCGTARPTLDIVQTLRGIE